MEELKCKICGCLAKDDVYFKKHKLLCNRHYLQLKFHGKILERTIYDPNEIILFDDHAEIILYDKQCKERARALIDLEDVERCKQYKWSFSHGYVRCASENISLHNKILESYGEKDTVVHHKNKNTLDNRKYNLDTTTQQNNTRDRTIQSNNQTGFVGVHHDKKSSRYESSIYVSGCKKTIGYFDEIKDAIKYRLVAEKLYFGKYSPQQHLFKEYNIEHIDEVECKNILDKLKNQPRKDSSSGVTGVSWNKRKNRWETYITISGERKKLGYYTNLNEAIKVRLLKEKEYFGESSPQKWLFEQYGIES